MKHQLGNTPKCISCYYYRDREPNDKCRYDGWCTNKYNCSHGINGKKRDKPLEREPVMWNWECRQWEDAETRLTHFEVCTRTPEPWKTPLEQEHVKQILREAENA